MAKWRKIRCAFCAASGTIAKGTGAFSCRSCGMYNTVSKGGKPKVATGFIGKGAKRNQRAIDQWAVRNIQQAREREAVKGWFPNGNLAEKSLRDYQAELERTYRTSTDPAEREMAFGEILKLRGLNA